MPFVFTRRRRRKTAKKKSQDPPDFKHLNWPQFDFEPMSQVRGKKGTVSFSRLRVARCREFRAGRLDDGNVTSFLSSEMTTLFL